MTVFIVLPGINGSGPDHWQSHWEAADPAFRRFEPSSWDEPDLDDWIAALDRAVLAAPEPPVLVAHSLSCLLVAHWAARSKAPVVGAWMVAMPDSAGPDFPAEAASFRTPPLTPLPFPALLVASSNDPWGPTDYVRARAEVWGAALAEVGALGHINAASGLGDWPDGRARLDAFVSGLKA